MSFDIFEVWATIQDEKSIKLPVWKEVGVTQALGLCLTCLLCPSFVTTSLLYVFLGYFFIFGKVAFLLLATFIHFHCYKNGRHREKSCMMLFTHKSKAWYYNMHVISLKSCCWDSLLLTNLLISSLTFCAASMLGRFKLCLCSSGGPLFIWGLGMGCVLQSWRICSMV